MSVEFEVSRILNEVNESAMPGSSPVAKDDGEPSRRVTPEIVAPKLDGVRVIGMPSLVSMRRIDLTIPAGGSIADMFKAVGLEPGVPARVFLDNRMIAVEERSLVFPKGGEVVTIRAIPGVQVLIYLAVVAAIGFAQGGGRGALSNVFSLLGPQLGPLLTNALAPPSQPSLPKFTSQPRSFSISGSQNVAAPFSPIPKIYGVRQISPQYAASPYIELIGGDQYLRMLFLLGYGPIDVTQIKIKDNPIEGFKDVEWELREGFPDDSPPRLYPGSVLEDDFTFQLSSNNVRNPPTASGWFTRTSGTQADELNVIVQALNGFVCTDLSSGNNVPIQCTLQIQWVPAGTGWLSPNMEPDIVLGSHGKGHSRRSHTWRVPRGQYDVRVQVIRFTNAESSWGNVFYQAQWTFTSLTTIRAQAPFSMQGLALLALRIRASRQLNGVIDNLNCVAASILPDYNSLATGDPWRDRAGGWFYDYHNQGAGAVAYSLVPNATDPTAANTTFATTGKRWIADQQMGVANGSTVTFAGTFLDANGNPLAPIQKGSLIISCGTKASATSGPNSRKKAGIVLTLPFISDDGNGNIVGPTVTAGTINYATGAYSITFSPAPSAPDNPTADFVLLIQTTAAGRALAIKTASGSADGASVASKSIPCNIRVEADASTGVTPPVKFTVSGWYKASAAIASGIRIRVLFGATEDFAVGAGMGSIDIIANGAATTAWQQFTQQVTVPAPPSNNPWMRVIAYHNPDGVGGVTVYFDDFSAKPNDQGTTAVEWMPNPSFDFAGRITSNPASIYRDVLQGPANKIPLADTRLDLTTNLPNWWTNCNNNSRFFNGIFDQPGTVFDTLRAIAPLGRAAYQLRDGLYSVVQDVAQSSIVQHFTPRNSWGFKGTFAFPNLPQALRVRWTNPANDWQPDERIVYDDKAASGGVAETAVLFNGSSGEVTLPTLLATVNANATLEAWVNLPASGAKGCFIKLGNGDGFGLGVGAAGTSFDDSNPGTALIGLYESVAWLFPTGNPTLSTGVWHHVAMVIGPTATVPTFYIDGTAYAGTASNTPNAPTSAGIIGQDPAGTRWSNATIARAAVYSFALSGTRIAAHAAATTDAAYDTAVLADSPVAFYKLSESSGANAADSSGDGKTGTYSGAGVTLGQTGPLTGAVAYDATTTTLFETLDLTNSVTDINQAWKEGRFHLAQGRLRPQTYELQCDVENLVCQRGDLIRVSHDVIAQGLGFGRVKTVQLDGSSNCTGVTLDETSLSFESGHSYALRIRRSVDGSSLLGNLSLPTSGTGETGFLFDGVSGRVNLPLVTSAVKNVTLECWVMLPNSGTHGPFMNVGNPSGGDGYGIGCGNPDYESAGNRLLGVVENIVFVTPIGTPLLSVGIWHHVALTIDNSSVWTFYLDGVLYAGGTPGAANIPTGQCAIAFRKTGGASFNGQVARAAIYGAPLSAARIVAHFNALTDAAYDAAVLADNPLSFNKLAETSGTTAADSSSHGNNGSIVATTTLGQSGPFLTTPIMVFNPAIPAATTPPAVGDLAMFGLQGAETGQFLVTKIEPGQDLSAIITFVDYSPEIYAADATPTTQSSQIAAPPSVVAPVIASIFSDDTHSKRSPDGTILGQVHVALTPPLMMLSNALEIVSLEYEIRVNSTSGQNNRGAWASGTTYATGDVVTSGGNTWVSIISGNLGVTPGTDGSKWTLTGESTPWEVPARVPASEMFVIDQVEPNTTYDIQVRYIYKDGTFSPWSLQTAYTVQGQVTLPPDVTGLTATNMLVGRHKLKWDKPTLPNIREAEIRQGSSWAIPPGAFVDRVKKTIFVTDPLPSGPVMFWVAWMDTSGNYSLNPASVTVNPTTNDTVGKNVDTPGINPNAVTSAVITDIVTPIILGLPAWASAHVYANGNQIADSSNDAQQVVDQKVTQWNVASGTLANGCGTSLDDFPWQPTTATPSPTGPTISISKPWISQSLALKSASTTVPITRRAVVTPAAQVAASSVVVNVPAGTVNGDGIVFAIVVGSTSATVTTPIGLTFIRADSNAGTSGNGSKTWLYYRVASSEPASYTFSISASNPVSGGAVGYVGTASGAFVDQNAGSTGTGTTITVQAVTPSQAFDEILNIYTWSNNNTTTTRTLTPTSSLSGGSAPTWNTALNGYTQDNYDLWQNVGAGQVYGMPLTLATAAVTVLATSDHVHFVARLTQSPVNMTLNDEADFAIYDAPNYPSMSGAVAVDSEMPFATSLIAISGTAPTSSFKAAPPIYNEKKSGFGAGAHTFVLQAKLVNGSGSGTFRTTINGTHFDVADIRR
jgi:hypothetical protein